jgi:hypothetical protein
MEDDDEVRALFEELMAFDASLVGATAPPPAPAPPRPRPPAPPPVDDDDEGGGRTRMHQYTAEEAAMSQRPAWEQEQRDPLGDLDDDDGGGRTRMHQYSAEEAAMSLRPAWEQPDEEDDGGARTRMHQYSPEERAASLPPGAPSAGVDDEDEGGVRTRFHQYTLEERIASAPPGPVSRPTPVPTGDDDDAHTLFKPAPLRAPPRGSSSFAAMPSPISSGPAFGPPSSQKPVRPSLSNMAPVSGPAPASSDRRPGFGPGPSTPRPASRPGFALDPRQPPPAPPSARASFDAPIVDLGDLLADDFLGEAPPAPASAPLPPADEDDQVPSLRSYARRALDDTYLEALGGPAAVPGLAVSPAQLTALPLGPQAGFLLSCVDGASSVDEILDISSLSRLDTLRILYELMQQGVLAVRKRR